MQKKIIYFLTSIAFLLIILNVYIESNPPNKINLVSDELSVNAIDSIFISTLFSNGIIEAWIEAKPIRNKRHDSLKHVYYINVPKDIPIVALLSDITRSFKNLPVELTAEEKINNSKSSLKIYSNNVLKFETFLNPTNKIAREYAEICFIADVTTQNEDQLKTKLNSIPYPFTKLLAPSSDTEKLVRNDSLNIKSYVLLLSDNIDDKKYVLNPESSKESLSESIDDLIGNFRDAKALIIDEKSIIYNSLAYSFVREKLAEKNSAFVEKSKFINLTNKKFEQVVSIFEFHCVNGKSKQRRELIISIDDLIKLQPYIAKQKKLGNRFIAM